MDSNFTHLFKLSEWISIEFSIQSRRFILSESLEIIGELLKKVLREPELQRFMLSVDEVLQNAYEHGNLELSHAQKKNYLRKDILDDELRKREEKFSTRTISIKMEVRNQILSFSVKDQGKGFNWRKLKGRKSNLDSLHGRGLSIIQAATDKVEFNKAGNSIKLSKALSQPINK